MKVVFLGCEEGGLGEVGCGEVFFIFCLEVGKECGVDFFVLFNICMYL